MTGHDRRRGHESKNAHGRHEHGHGRAHARDKSGASGKRIFWVTVLNAVITLAEIAGGLLSGSLALLSDAVHNFSDTAAVALSYFTGKIAQRPKDAKRTYGYKRAEILSAFVNSSVLLAVSFMLIVEAFKRLKSPETIDGTLMITVALIGLAADIVSVLLLESQAHKSLNLRSSYLHLISDAISSVGVLAGGVVIKLWGVVWVDPLVTAVISVFIIKETVRIIKKTVDILMQSSAKLDYDAIIKGIEAMDKVVNIHHIHCWMSDESTVYFEAHIDMEDIPLSEVQKVYDRIERFLKEEHGVSHVTLQAETDKCCSKDVF